MPSKLPTTFERFQKLADSALSTWAPGSKTTFQELKATGESGSAIVKVDISPTAECELEAGQYILKLSEYSQWHDQEEESTAHKRAEEHDQLFADQHIPRLRRVFAAPHEHNLGYALLYEIAGRSLDSYVGTDVKESPGFLEICGDVAQDLLEHWFQRTPSEELSPHGLLEKWLGYRLDPVQAKELHDFSNGLSVKTPGVLLVNGEALPNPIAFYNFAKKEGWENRAIFGALAHNDLHGGNLLVHRRNPSSKNYWIIDFALSTIRPAGFDHAYLELAHILYCIGDSDPALLIDLLRLVDQPEQKRLVPSGTKWLLDVIHIMRRTTNKWLEKAESRRLDDVNRQFLLARVAAGLNWARKPLSDNRRAVALYYAGWACKKFLYAHEPESGARFWRECASEPTSPPSAPKEDEANLLLWEQLWTVTDGFSPRAGRLILVSEAHRNVDHLAVLGRLPVSAVIDLDPQSQELGLYHAVEPVIDSLRSVHTSSGGFGPIDFTRGTAWMMAAGWSLKSEAPTDLTTWRFRKLEAVRALARKVEEQTNPDPLVVLSIAGSGLDADMPHARLEHVLDAIEEATLGRAAVFHIGASALSPRIRHTHLPIDLSYVLTALSRAFGSTADQLLPQIPGKDRKPRALPIESLRAMEENLDVLHSSILDSESARNDRGNDSFWRGNPPTWFDLHAGVDIKRDITDTLVREIRETIEEVRNRTILLYHTPGAGGTTVAFRAAWDIHAEHPTAVLRRYSPALPDRLQDLYNRSETTILLVADGSSLSESEREDLYREMQHRNVRMVLLYVRRVFQAPRGTIAIADPMNRGEAERFRDAYSLLVQDDFRKGELERITTSDDFERYRTPFFYGLTAFERDFQGTATYVEHHIAGIRGKRREVLEYLGLATVFSNSGLHEVFLRRMLGLSDTSSLDISEGLGEGPVRLTIRRNGLFRLMHQVIAEQVLDHCQGANWRLELRTLSVDLISDLARFSDKHSRTVVELLRQMFVERQGTEVDDVEDRQRFSPLIETVDAIDPAFGHRVLLALKDAFPSEAHFWNHLGRHQIYRMKRDFDKAETYLAEATRLSPDDFIHHHTLGLVRKYRVRQMLNASKTTAPTDLIREVTPLFDGAVRAFERTRQINQDNIYAYITHVQMILEVTSKLKLASAVRTVAQIPGDAQDWVQDQISIASDLIDTARELYTTLDKTDTFLTSCVADLEKLYDNLDDVIEIWELAQERTGGSPVGRRALAYAYVNRSGERWSTLQSAELRRIVGLMELNLRHAGRREDDYKLWFEAYKLLPEFDIDEALSRLRVWAERFPSWRAYFYIYAIQFHLWFSGRSQRTDDFEKALDQCKEIAFGRTNISHSWLGFAPAVCPLVASADLGEWDRKKNLWRSTDGLRRINGVIDFMHGPQAGWILIEGHVKAFFVPGKEFSANKDENEPVSFFIGFSPSGLRARGVERGWVADGGRAAAVAPDTVVFAPSILVASDELKKRRAKELKLDRVRGFARDLVRAKAALGLAIGLDELASAIDARFGVDGVAAELGQDIRGLVSSMDGMRIVDREGRASVQDELAPEVTRDENKADPVREQGQVFRRYRDWGMLRDKSGTVRSFKQAFVRRGQWRNVKDGTIVGFKPDVSSEGDIALDVEVLRQGDVRTLVQELAVSIIHQAADGGSVLRKKELVQKLRNILRGDIPGLRPGPGGGLEPLLREVDGITFRGEPDHRTVHMNESRAIGKLPDRPIAKAMKVPQDGGIQKGAAGTRSVTPPSVLAPPQSVKTPKPNAPVTAGSIDRTAVQKKVIEILSSEPARRLSLPELGNQVLRAFRLEGPLARHLGAKTFAKFLETVEGVHLERVSPTVAFASLDSGQRADAGPKPSRPSTSGAKPAVTLDPSNPDLQRIVTFVSELIEGAERSGRPIVMASLGATLGKEFGLRNANIGSFGFKSIKELVASIPGISFESRGSHLVVRRQGPS